MSESSDELQQRIRFVTRSGRSVRPPNRYEPDPNQILEDDFSDALSDIGSGEDEWGYGMEAQTEDDEFLRELTDSEEDDFTDTESHDSSYESSATDTLSSEDADTDREEEDETEEDEQDEFTESEDLVEWDTLTVDASDPDSSEDDRDL